MNWICKNFSALNINQLYKLLQLRSEVFVLEQQCAYQDLDAIDYHCYHFWAEIEDEIVACARIVPKGIKYNEVSIGRVATHLKHRNKNLGKELMYNVLQKAQELFPNENIRISAQSYLIRFYNNFGFIPTGNEYLEDNIPHIEMLLQK